MARRIRRGRPRLRRTQKIAYRREIYKYYEAKKIKTVNRLRKKGLPVKGEEEGKDVPLIFDAFEAYYKEYKEKMPKYSAKQIINRMVSDEVYRFSEEQYLGTKRAIEENREFFEDIGTAEDISKASREQFRTGRIGFTAEDYEVMRETYHRLKENYLKLGKSPRDAWDLARQDIANIYWGGSP